MKKMFVLITMMLMFSSIATALTIEPSLAHTMGDKDAPIHMVAYLDFECPYCQQFHAQTFDEIKDNYIDEGLVYYEFKHLPLAFHGNAYKAAMASECAGAQSNFWEMHDMLLENGVGEGLYDSYAEEIGLNIDDFEYCMDNNKYDQVIQQNILDAQTNGLSGTPSFIINEQVVSGAQPYENFEQVFEDILGDERPVEFIFPTYGEIFTLDMNVTAQFKDDFQIQIKQLDGENVLLSLMDEHQPSALVWLGEGEKENVNGRVVSVGAVGDDFVTLKVTQQSKDIYPPYGDTFKLVTKQSVIFEDNSEMKLTSSNPQSAKIQLQKMTGDMVVGTEAYLEIGEQTTFGNNVITLIDSDYDWAVFLVEDADSIVPAIVVDFGEVFKLKKGNIENAVVGNEVGVELLDIDSRKASIKLSVEGSSISKTYVVMQGDSIEYDGYVMRVLDLEKEGIALVVKDAEASTVYAHLNQYFVMTKDQLAVVENLNFYLRRADDGQVELEVLHNALTKNPDAAIDLYSTQVILNQGESASMYGYNILNVKSTDGKASFIVSKDNDSGIVYGTLNSYVTLQENQTVWYKQAGYKIRLDKIADCTNVGCARLTAYFDVSENPRSETDLVASWEINLQKGDTTKIGKYTLFVKDIKYGEATIMLRGAEEWGCPATCKEVDDGCLCPKIDISRGSQGYIVGGTDIIAKEFKLQPGDSSLRAVTDNKVEVDVGVENIREGVELPVTIKGVDKKITLSTSDDLWNYIQDDSTKARTRETLITLNDGFGIETKTGKAQIEVLPTEAKEKATSYLKQDSGEVELATEDGRAVYKANIEKKVHVLGIIPVHGDYSVTIDAQNANVLRESKPWYDSIST